VVYIAQQLHIVIAQTASKSTVGLVEPTLYLVGVGSTGHPVQPHMNKCLKKINMMGYMVFLKNGRHHQHMKVERIKFKKKQENKKTQA